MAKLGKNEFPSGTTEDDFKCFGPVATKDTEFAGCRLADLGCFQQEEKGVTKDGGARKIDSNKMYHAAVVQHKTTKAWYLYIEFGRVGQSTTFQFSPCSSESEAEREFVKQCNSKNTSRGEWSTIAGCKIFVPKKDSKGNMKDLYSVRQLVARDVGLPDARNLVTGDVPVAKPKVGNKKSSKCDPQTLKLMRDLLGGTVQYARTTLQGGSIPSQSAIDDGRDILLSAKKRLVQIGNDIDDQINDRDLKSLTYALYSRIPKIKPLNVAESTWILSADNINEWDLEIDAFESALKTGDFEVEDDSSDPMQGMPLNMEWIDPCSILGEYLYTWWTGANRGRYSVGKLKIHNMWKVDRHGDDKILTNTQMAIVPECQGLTDDDRPLHQDKKRPDLTVDQRKLYWSTNTNALFHGSRSCNITGILRENFRLPKELVKVQTNGANMGSGIYGADDWQKSAQYCSSPGSMYAGNGGIKGRNSFMFLCDFCLGKPHVVGSGSGSSMTAPKGTHSVFGKGGMSGGYLANNEFVIYEKGRTQIRYLAEITY